MRPDYVAQRDEPAIFGRQRRIGGELGLDLDHAGRVEFAVQGGVKEKRPVFAPRVSHARLPSCSISLARARASLDITVPTGAPIASAISR